MFVKHALPLSLLVFALSTLASATTLTFGPSEVALGQGAGPGSYGSVTNQWHSFGIDVSNAYLYNNNGDTFDQIGIASPTSAGGTITFVTAQNNIKIDYVVSIGNTGTYVVYNANGNTLDSIITAAPNSTVNGTYTINARNISRLTFSGTAGNIRVSTVYFNGTSPAVPEPATMGLMGLSLVALTARKFFNKR